MICFRPLKLYKKTGQYKTTAWGPEPFYEDALLPCGKCEGCIQQRAKMWSNRMFWEADYHNATSFATLTLEQEPEDKSVAKDVLQRFIKRLRKKNEIKYYACGEYGETYGRPHYHAVLFGISTAQTKEITNTWGLGDVKLSSYIPNRGLYTAGYMLKNVRPDIDLRGRTKPFAIMSQGIGKRFAIANREKIAQRQLTIYGKKVSTPRYFTESLGIEQIDEIEYDEGDIYDIHSMRHPELNPVKDWKKILEYVEESRKQTAKNWLADHELRRHENGL